MIETERLTSAQRRALVSLLEDGDHANAAMAARRSLRTVRRWLKDDAFQNALAAAGREVMADSLFTLQRGAAAAADALTSMASGSAEASAARVAACRAVLDLARSGTEISELTEMVDELAMRLEQRKAGGFPQ